MSETADPTDDENSQPSHDATDRLEEFQSAIERIQGEEDDDGCCC